MKSLIAILLAVTIIGYTSAHASKKVTVDELCEGSYNGCIASDRYTDAKCKSYEKICNVCAAETIKMEMKSYTYFIDCMSKRGGGSKKTIESFLKNISASVKSISFSCTYRCSIWNTCQIKGAWNGDTTKCGEEPAQCQCVYGE